MSKKNSKDTAKRVSVGGQALMEGIMMKGPEGTAMALRLPDGSIETSRKPTVMWKDKYKILGWPLIRGPVTFIESMIDGYKYTMESAEKTSLDFSDSGEEEMSKFDKWIVDHFGEKMMTVIGVISAVIGFALAFGLFVYLPSKAFEGLNILADNKISTAWRAPFEGLIRVIIFVSYMALISLMKDIKRMFQYHGAEHKSIFCYEAGLELTVENVKKQSRFHPRCGTSFIFVTIILSILVSSVVAGIFDGTPVTTNTALWICIKILILPIVTSLSYEFIRYAGCHDNLFIKTLAAPGLLMQRITTKEPEEDAIIEIGIAALKVALGLEEPNIGKAKEENGEVLADAQETAEIVIEEPKEE